MNIFVIKAGVFARVKQLSPEFDFSDPDKSLKSLAANGFSITETIVFMKEKHGWSIIQAKQEMQNHESWKVKMQDQDPLNDKEWKDLNRETDQI